MSNSAGGTSQYPSDVNIKERDDGYYVVETHQDSAMGRRSLILKPEEYESLEREVCDDYE